MFCLSGRGGYQSPAIGAWSYAIALQLSMGVYIFFSYSDLNDMVALHHLNNIAEFSIKSLTKFQIFGLLHIALALCTAVPFILGHLFCRCFLLPMIVVNYLQSALSTATTGLCGYFLQTGGRSLAGELSKFQALPTVLVSMVYKDPNEFAMDYRPNLFATGILSFIIGYLYRCAVSHKRSTDHVTTMITMPALALGYGLGFATLSPTMDTTLIVLGSLIVVICTAAEFVIHFTQCRALKWLNAVLLCLYAALAAVSVFLWIYTVKIATSGHMDLTTYSTIATGKVETLIKENKNIVDNVVDLDLLRTFLLANTKSISLETINFMLENGKFTLCIIILSGTTVLYSLFAVLYCTRDICGCFSTNNDDKNP